MKVQDVSFQGAHVLLQGLHDSLGVQLAEQLDIDLLDIPSLSQDSDRGFCCHQCSQTTVNIRVNFVSFNDLVIKHQLEVQAERGRETLTDVMMIIQASGKHGAPNKHSH